MASGVWGETTGRNGTPRLVDGVFEDGVWESLVGEVEEPEVRPRP